MSRLERREFLRLILSSGAASFAISSGFLTGCQKRKKLPNILIFLADDLGYGDLGCYGNRINLTTNIDAFAAEGIRFTDFHSAGTVCSPSRASLLTGRHPYRMGFYYILGGGAHLRISELTIASLLREAGYSTCFTGKWHLTDFDSPEKKQPDPGTLGFDHWFATVVNAFDGPENPGKFYRNGEAVGPTNGWYCDLIVQEAADWLKTRKEREKPFFLLVSSHEPHTPIAPPKQYSDLFKDPDVNVKEKDISYGRVPRPDNKDIADNKKYYYGTVAQLDNAFGNLLQVLDDEKLSDSTLVLFTSDNGPEYPVNFLESQGKWDDPIRDRCFGTPGPLRGMKRFTYEGGHRIPGIVRWPGKTPAGVTSDALINGTDILPTICEITGIPVPADRTIDGENIAVALSGEPFKRRNPVCWNFPVHEYSFIPSMSMRDGNYMLIAHFQEKEPEQLWMDWIKTTQPSRYELYDLSQDLGQENDISERMSEKVKELSEKLQYLWKDIQAEAPIWPEWKAK